MAVIGRVSDLLLVLSGTMAKQSKHRGCNTNEVRTSKLPVRVILEQLHKKRHLVTSISTNP